MTLGQWTRTHDSDSRASTTRTHTQASSTPTAYEPFSIHPHTTWVMAAAPRFHHATHTLTRAHARTRTRTRTPSTCRTPRRNLQGYTRTHPTSRRHPVDAHTPLYTRACPRSSSPASWHRWRSISVFADVASRVGHIVPTRPKLLLRSIPTQIKLPTSSSSSARLGLAASPASGVLPNRADRSRRSWLRSRARGAVARGTMT